MLLTGAARRRSKTVTGPRAAPLAARAPQPLSGSLRSQRPKLGKSCSPPHGPRHGRGHGAMTVAKGPSNGILFQVSPIDTSLQKGILRHAATQTAGLGPDWQVSGGEGRGPRARRTRCCCPAAAALLVEKMAPLSVPPPESIQEKLHPYCTAAPAEWNARPDVSLRMPPPLPLSVRELWPEGTASYYTFFIFHLVPSPPRHATTLPSRPKGPTGPKGPRWRKLCLRVVMERFH